MGTLIAVDTKTNGEGHKVLVTSPTRSGISFLFLGCSLPSTGEIGKTKEGALSFNLPSLNQDSEQHVLALVARCSGNFCPVLVPMDRSGIKLSKAFVPDPDRLADIIAIGCGDYALRVFYRPDSDTPVQIFTTQKGVPGTFYVADGNLLCRFLVGKAEIVELRAAAEEFVAELSVREQLNQIRAVLEEDMGGNDPGHDLAATVKTRLQVHRQQSANELAEANRVLRGLKSTIRGLKVRLGCVNETRWWQWCKRRREVNNLIEAVNSLVLQILD
ncbi:MAG: hypothetical protein WCW26_03690 [Candidatus Buchananbacteria bacterium]